MDGQTVSNDKNEPPVESSAVESEVESESIIKPNITSAGTSTEAAPTGSEAALPVPDLNQSADILKIDIDCFEELFEYLSLKELLIMGQTCKRLHQVVGYILGQNYSGVEVLSGGHGDLCIGDVDQAYCSIKFIQFMRHISLYFDNGLHYFRQFQSKFRRLNRIHFQYIQLTRPKVERLKEIFVKIEVLQIIKSEISGNIHEIALQFCPNIKHLSILGSSDDSDSDITGMDLFRQKYPTLERFECNISSDHHVIELKTFLQLNPNIKKLAISCTQLSGYMFGKPLWNSNIQLDELAISGRFIDIELCHMLQKLHEQGFYKRLKLYLQFSELSQSRVDQLATVNGLVKIYLGRSTYMHAVKLTNLQSLEEICIFESDRVSGMDVNLLSNLERVYFGHATFNDVWIFISRAPRVKRIKIDYLREGNYFDATNGIINLKALNAERRKLDGAQKLTIYVKEEIYLTTKWAVLDTDFNLIRLKRIESIEWEHDFQHNLY